MDYTFFWYLGHASTFISLIPLVLFLFIFRRLIPTQRRLTTLIVLVFVTEITANVMWLQQLNNNPVYHIYAVLEFYMILRIFKLELNNLLSNKIFNLLIITFFGFAIANAIWVQDVFSFNSNVTTASSLIIIVLVFIYFSSLLQKESLQPLHIVPMFWIGAGMTLYYTTNLALFFITSYELFVFENRHTIWSIHAIVNIILFCFYTYALWIQPKTE